MSTRRGGPEGDPPAVGLEGLEGADLDKALLSAHLAGDPDAFAELVRRHQQRLWAVALRTLGDPDEAADALQDALLSAFRAAGSFRGDAAVTTWLHRVVVNACLDRVRRARGRRTVPGLDASSDVPAHTPGDPESHVDVVRALARLPEHQRVAIVLVDLQDMPVVEAAAVLGVPTGTVKSRCARGRAALAEMLRLDDRSGPGNTEHPNSRQPNAQHGNRPGTSSVPRQGHQGSRHETGDTS